jgi:hypothetical protein
MFQRLADSLAYLRPRAQARTRKTLDDLLDETQELKRAVRTLADQQRTLEGSMSQWVDEMRQHLSALVDVRQTLSTLALRESQLRAIVRADAAQEDAYAELDTVLDEERIAAHVRKAIAGAELRLDPFPHVVVDGLFPIGFYKTLIRALPPVELFEERPVNDQEVALPLMMGPVYSRRVWRYMTRVVAPRVLADPIVEKFRAPLEDWISANWPSLSASPLAAPMELHSSAGRILLRRPGYNIPPHRDPKWGFLTCLVYLARPGDPEAWGTQLYAVDDDDEAQGAKPHWVEPDRCRLVTEVPFKRNSALLWLNSIGAHGAFIPQDVQPPDLQRYAYQFRIGPTRDSIAALMELLPQTRRDVWSGKLAADSAGGAARNRMMH